MKNKEKGSGKSSHIEWDTIFQAIGHPAMILKPDHTIVSANRAALKAVNKSPEELIGQKCYEIFHVC
ncbi:PAS domain-containing protein [candidate division WOR-3 bacterium]|nr:PAS domain-containing protein [candidate division WOR-3 bacterium]